MSSNFVIAMYRPHAGKDAELAELVARHLPALREQGLVTDYPGLHLKASDGTWLEIFEWVDGGAEKAHTDPVVGPLWGAMAEVADFPPLAELPEANGRFPHFARAAVGPPQS